MTREEAIECIEAIHVQMFNSGNSKWTKACDMAIEALKNIQVIDKIPQNYLYDTETEHCLVYRHKYTGKEIHILKPTDLLVLERPHGEWIPCEERLPEEHYTYLVTIKNTSGSTFTATSYFFTKEAGWSHDGVIAWMPFPKPYKEEGEKE